MNDVVEPDFRLGLCAVCRKHPATQFCDYIIEYHNNPIFIRGFKEFQEANRRGEQYETCDLPMCGSCSREVSKDHEFCPHHYELYLKRELPSKFQRKRRFHTRNYIAGKEIFTSS